MHCYTCSSDQYSIVADQNTPLDNSSSNLQSPTSLELPHLSSVPVLTGPTSVEHGTLNPRVVGSSPTLGATVKTERGKQVTTGNRTRVVRLAVTNANHYTKRSHDHLAWSVSGG
ncbi:hypothetical protein Bbelb_153740 [Branchiostoma belcheri]|nr:hypothetical protein Bbelb_153740 [Branchiostoma belcheri]